MPDCCFLIIIGKLLLSERLGYYSHAASEASELYPYVDIFIFGKSPFCVSCPNWNSCALWGSKIDWDILC